MKHDVRFSDFPFSLYAAVATALLGSLQFGEWTLHVWLSGYCCVLRMVGSMSLVQVLSRSVRALQLAQSCVRSVSGAAMGDYSCFASCMTAAVMFACRRAMKLCPCHTRMSDGMSRLYSFILHLC